LADLHWNGVHVECRPAHGRLGVSDVGSARRCRYAGKVERLHGHDFEGPLVCGCTDFAWD